MKPPQRKRVVSETAAAREHHRKHGDMDGNVCLLSKCAIHYPGVRVEVTKLERGK